MARITPHTGGGKCERYTKILKSAPNNTKGHERSFSDDQRYPNKARGHEENPKDLSFPQK
jgi:hypothetical protein